MEIVSTIMLTMAWAIPLVVLLFVAWVAMQNIRSARQDKKRKGMVSMLRPPSCRSNTIATSELIITTQPF